MATGRSRPSSPPVTATGAAPGRKLRKTDERAARLLDAWRRVFPRGRQSTAQVAAAICNGGPRHKALKEAVEAVVGKKHDGIAVRLGVFLRQRRVESDRYRLVAQYDSKAKAWRYWIEIRGEPEPLYVVPEPALDTLMRVGRVDFNAAPVLIEPDRPPLSPIAPPLPGPVAPVVGGVPVVSDRSDEQAIEQGPIVYAYPNGSVRIRGSKHLATLAKAGGDLQPGLRTVAQAPRAAVRLQSSPSVFADAAPPPFDDGPTLPQMKWKPPGTTR